MSCQQLSCQQLSWSRSKTEAVTEDAAGDPPGPPWEAGVPCGGRDAGATPGRAGNDGGAPRPGRQWIRASQPGK